MCVVERINKKMFEVVWKNLFLSARKCMICFIELGMGEFQWVHKVVNDLQ